MRSVFPWKLVLPALLGVLLAAFLLTRNSAQTGVSTSASKRNTPLGKLPTSGAVASSNTQLAPYFDVLLGRESLAMEMGPLGLELHWAEVPGATGYRITRVGHEAVTLPAGKTSYTFDNDWARRFFSLTNATIEPIDVSVIALRDGVELSTMRGVAPCPSVGFIAARGSGQNFLGNAYGRGLGSRGARLLDLLRERMAATDQALPAIAVDYDAVEIFGPGFPPRPNGAWPMVYNSSVRKGVGVAKLAVLKTLNACPNVSLILFGYSQGAQVMGDVFAELPAVARQRVARVILFADATYRPNDTRVRYLPTPLPGNGIKGPRAQFPPDDDAVIESWCWAEDVVCQGLPRTAQHGDIYDTYEALAAENAFAALPSVETPRSERFDNGDPAKKMEAPCYGEPLRLADRLSGKLPPDTPMPCQTR